MQPDIDRERLSRDVRQWLSEMNLTTRGAALIYPGLNPAMISRACSEQILSAASMILLCEVMKRKPSEYLLLLDGAKRNQTVTAIVPRETRGTA